MKKVLALLLLIGMMFAGPTNIMSANNDGEDVGIEDLQDALPTAF